MRLPPDLGVSCKATAFGVGGKPRAFSAEASAFTFKTVFAGTCKVGVHGAGRGMTTGFSAAGKKRW